MMWNEVPVDDVKSFIEPRFHCENSAVVLCVDFYDDRVLSVGRMIMGGMLACLNFALAIKKTVATGSASRVLFAHKYTEFYASCSLS